ncbi:MAG TPA: hypothetical protein VGI19_08345 [Candidatus Cybelea sp.]|jgi:hypothetical protein
MFVYRNLSTGKWQYGVSPKQPLKSADGKAIRFAEIHLANVTFKLSETSRQRCLRQLADPDSRHGWDVHAYACGDVIAAVASGTVARPAGKVTPITYDKHGCGKFIRKDTGAELEHCEHVVFAADGHSCVFGDVR